MYIPDFVDLIESLDSLGHDKNILDFFPTSFAKGKCMNSSDVFYKTHFKNSVDLPFQGGLILGSFGDKVYSEKNRDYLGLIILDFDLGYNYLTPFVAKKSSREIVVDENNGFKTQLGSFDQVPNLWNVLSEIDKHQRDSCNSLKNKGLEFACSLAGRRPVDSDLDGLYQLLDLELYQTRLE